LTLKARLRHAHHLICNAIRLPLVLVVGLTDSQLGLQGPAQ
jgi:hypothetical protein